MTRSSGARVLMVVAPLGLTLWVLVIATGVILVLIAIGVWRHLARVRADLRRQRVRAHLEPVFSRFLESPEEAVTPLSR